jgi:hypothetical protein
MQPSMDNKEQRSAWEAPALSRGAKARNLVLVGGAIGVVALGALLLMRVTAGPALAPASPAVAAPSAELVAVEFEKLKGRWVRPDGGYVLELKRLLPDNALEAAYFNPNPIHVGKAKLYKERGFTKVFVELQDVNYPGSTYTLIYDVANDQLCGTYYQATQQQEYQIAFERLPPGS